jgi:dTDP-4-amino-4,6-dideoxygalactose transaminase
MAAVEPVVRGGKYIGGSWVKSFEIALGEYLGGGYVVGVGNGLDALTLSLLSLDIGPGDEVIVPTHSFIATWIAVRKVGAVAVGVDVDPSTGLVDLEKVEKKITKKTKAFLPVHLYGAPVDLSAIYKVMAEADIRIVEDCAQALGASVSQAPAGTLGDIGAFSFYPTKNLGALGDGGAIFTKSQEVADRVRSLGSYGFKGSRYEFSDLGINSRLDPIQAAFLNSKLPFLDKEGSHRNWQAEIYEKALDGKHMRPIKAPGVNSVYHHFAVLSSDRTSIREKLLGLGVETDMHYPYTMEAFTNLSPKKSFRVNESDLLGSRELASKVITFPIGSWLDKETTFRVAEAISEIN